MRETPKDAILRVAAVWESQTQEKALRSAPSPVLQYTARATSRVTFAPDRDDVKESLRVDESFHLADGAVIECGTELTVKLGARFAEHAEEPAVELARPAINVPRVCSRAGLPEPMLDIPATVARFSLRGDRLMPYAPPTEKREYIPAP